MHMKMKKLRGLYSQKPIFQQKSISFKFCQKQLSYFNYSLQNNITTLLFGSFVTMAIDPDPIMCFKKGLSW